MSSKAEQKTVIYENNQTLNIAKSVPAEPVKPVR